MQPKLIDGRMDEADRDTICFSFRREWDVCLVAAYHPDGTAVPQNWVLPDVPSDQAWASALLSADPQSDSH